MKKIIFISIILNLALVAGIAHMLKKNSPSVSSKAALSTKPISKKNQLSSKSHGEIETIFVTNAAPKFNWETVESEDYKKYIANLRAIDCPEETIRDIIIADVEKYYAKKLRPLRKKEEQPFWKNSHGWGGDNAEFSKAVSRFEKEKKALLKELLGIDYWKERAKRNGWDSGDDPFMESLPQEKKDSLQTIQENFQEMKQEIHRKARGYFDQDDQEELEKIQRQEHEEMAKVLSPDELFEYEVRHSEIASNLKYNDLQGFDASEQEFRAIFKAKQAQEFAGVNDESDSVKKAAREQWKEAENFLKASLGEDRFKEFKMAENWDYRNLVQMTERQGLPKDSARKVYEMKDEVEKAAQQIRSDKNLTPAQRKQKLLEIKTATETAATETLGPKGFKSWKRNAWWLRNLSN
ncbi:MAG: hypothetical protein M3Y82_13700 [Verrucomicrobiota bacterium]|nr:hypothetical protein [Verrucomicrobiota bacterium]